MGYNPTKEKVREIWTADPNFPRRKTAADLGVNVRTIYKYLSEFSSSKLNPQKPKSKAKKEDRGANFRTLSVSTLIDNERLDIKKIIRTGIKNLPVGQVAYDDAFKRDLQIADTRWREYSRDPEFDPYRATLPNKKVVWGKAPTINEVKKMDGVT